MYLFDEAEELHSMRTLVRPVHLRLDLVRARLRVGLGVRVGVSAAWA